MVSEEWRIRHNRPKLDKELKILIQEQSMVSYRELLEQKRRDVPEVDAREALRMREHGATFIDVREQDEFDQGAIPGAVHIPRGFLEMRIEESVRDPNRPSSSFAPAARGRFSPPSRCSNLATIVLSRWRVASTAGKAPACLGASRSP